LNDIHISRQVQCQFKMTNVQGDQAPAEWQKMFKKFENSSTKAVTEQSMRSQALLGSVMEFQTENLNIRSFAAKFVPWLLTDDQKQRRINVCLELREKANEDATFIHVS
jgi:hypothetical protein